MTQKQSCLMDLRIRQTASTTRAAAFWYCSLQVRRPSSRRYADTKNKALIISTGPSQPRHCDAAIDLFRVDIRSVILALTTLPTDTPCTIPPPSP